MLTKWSLLRLIICLPILVTTNPQSTSPIHLVQFFLGSEHFSYTEIFLLSQMKPTWSHYRKQNFKRLSSLSSFKFQLTSSSSNRSSQTTQSKSLPNPVLPHFFSYYWFYFFLIVSIVCIYLVHGFFLCLFCLFISLLYFFPPFWWNNFLPFLPLKNISWHKRRKSNVALSPVRISVTRTL